jgi:hypothetical protein
MALRDVDAFAPQTVGTFKSKANWTCIKHTGLSLVRALEYQASWEDQVLKEAKV